MSRETHSRVSSVNSEIDRTEKNIIRTDGGLLRLELAALKMYARLDYRYSPELDLQLQALLKAVDKVREKLEYLRRMYRGHCAKRDQIQAASKSQARQD